ncbi:pyridine nucleotide transhydrogenase [Alteromonas sediminis]|uniref:Pyridine nucleotide transhydrogenase n=1 Tax=Alteromonas sediminis TaxID=2259342 RepID=A0A3N5XYL7_9ALTE|nr:pyridine nucleotide transhydrogenase [Alteromonas sediminis]RPJ66247.1 pyridine nucleotide transhydrogenase [Alteromonas sediminis]
MRKVVSAIMLTAICGVAHAESDKNQLFECMDTKTFEMNSQCVADNISNNVAFREVQTKITQRADDSSDYVMATMKFYPEQMRIEIVAHKDAAYSNVTQKPNTLAKR